MTWHTANYGDPYSELPTQVSHRSRKALYKCSELHSSKHTRSSGQPFLLRRPGSWGFGGLLKDTSESAGYPCRTWDSNPRPLSYESDSLTIRPRLPLLLWLLLLYHYSLVRSPEDIDCLGWWLFLRFLHYLLILILKELLVDVSGIVLLATMFHELQWAELGLFFNK